MRNPPPGAALPRFPPCDHASGILLSAPSLTHPTICFSRFVALARPLVFPRVSRAFCVSVCVRGFIRVYMRTLRRRPFLFYCELISKPLCASRTGVYALQGIIRSRSINKCISSLPPSLSPSLCLSLPPSLAAIHYSPPLLPPPPPPPPPAALSSGSSFPFRGEIRVHPRVHARIVLTQTDSTHARTHARVHARGGK